MATSYRSVRSIVDLSSYYLGQMMDDYRQGGDITQAQAEQKAETPTLIEATSEQLYDILSSAELPASHCPIIVRDETSKLNLERHIIAHTLEKRLQSVREEFSGSSEVQEEELNKKMKLEETRIRSYTLTIADAKGLEWNNVVLWNISSGSDHLLEKKLHERRALTLMRKTGITNLSCATHLWPQHERGSCCSILPQFATNTTRIHFMRIYSARIGCT